MPMPETNRFYQYFLAALKRCKNNKYDSQKALALDSGFSSGHISEILKGKKRASHEAQVKIATACEEDYLNFLSIGKRIIEGGAITAKEGGDLETKDKLIAAQEKIIELLEENKRLKAGIIEEDPMEANREPLGANGEPIN